VEKHQIGKLWQSRENRRANRECRDTNTGRKNMDFRIQRKEKKAGKGKE